MKRITVGILAHVDSGKTTLSEAILYLSGMIRTLGRVDKRDSFLDTFKMERERGITIFSKQAVFNLKDTIFTLIDTPGHTDFSPETERTLSILDAAILVVSASDGVQEHTKTLWQLLERHRIPVFIFVNKTDLPNSGIEMLTADIRRSLSDSCVPFDKIGNTEECAMSCEQLMNSYLSSGIKPDEINHAFLNRHLFPVCFGSALKTDGVGDLLDLLEKFSPEPEYPDTFGARVYKISQDDKGTRLTHLKVTGGELKVKDEITGFSHTSGEWKEKIEQIRIYSGTRFESVSSAPAGTVCAVTGLISTRCGDGLGAEKSDHSAVLEPVIRYSLEVPSGLDHFTVFSQLKRLEQEEPMLKTAYDEAAKEISVSVMGEIQLEVLKRIISDRYGFEPAFGAGSVVYRETISDTVEGIGHFEPLRHYSEVHLILEPAERGSGLTFESDCPENELARNWQNLVLTHLAEKEHKGVLIGAPITDMKITLVAGRAHKKHTEGGDFREATYRALRQGLKKAESILLEPWYSFTITLPTDNVGRAMSDIQRMGGKFAIPEANDGISVLSGEVPVSEMQMYAKELAAYTRGKGSIQYNVSTYEICHNAKEIIDNIGYDSDADLSSPCDSVFCANGAGFVVKWYDVEKYMHIESVLNNAACTDTEERSVKQRAADYISRAATDKELMEIFERTYGKIKPRTAGKVVFNPSVTGAEQEKPQKKINRQTVALSGKEYLLIDGYNIIFAWDELKKAAVESLDSARNQLINRICNYQGYSGCEIILVFDAYKVKKNPGTVEKFRNISVVYTKEAETADTYIERVSHELTKKHRVRVATSDASEQMIILGTGALRIPAAAFHKEVKDAEKAISEIISTSF